MSELKANGPRWRADAQLLIPRSSTNELFYRAQFGKAQRRDSGAGAREPGFTNLFSGIARCFYCRAPILFENKGDWTEGRQISHLRRRKTRTAAAQRSLALP